MWIVSILKGRSVSSFLFLTLPGKCRKMSGGGGECAHTWTSNNREACMRMHAECGESRDSGGLPSICTPPAEWRHHLHSPGCAEKQSTALPPLPVRRVSGTCLPLGTRLLLVCARSLRGKAASWCLSNPYQRTRRTVHTQSTKQTKHIQANKQESKGKLKRRK